MPHCQNGSKYNMKIVQKGKTVINDLHIRPD